MSTTLRNRASWTFGLPKTLHAFGVNIFLLPLGIATSVLIARTVGPTGKGTLDLSISLPQGITFVVAQGKVAANVIASQLVLVSLLQALVALAILILLRFTSYFQLFLPNWGLWILGGVVLYVWIELITKFWAAILTGQQHIAVVNNAEFVGRVTQFVSLFILAAALYFSPESNCLLVSFFSWLWVRAR
jgi:hypothetical protein